MTYGVEIARVRSSWLIGMFAAFASIASACKKEEPPPGAAAPGEPGEAHTSTAPPPAASAEPDPQLMAAAQAEVDRSYKGTDRTPPASALKPEPGKKVWIISPGQIGESASIATNAAKEAGTVVGWKMTLYDSKLDVSNFSLGIRQAIAAKADGIILHSIDCPLVKQALIEARASKVKVVAYYSLDCDDPSVKGQPLYDGSVNFGSQFGDYASLTRSWGAAKADWLITKLHGKVKAISFKEDELLVVKYIREGFEQELAKCKTCEVVKTVDFTLADLGPKLQQKAQGALLQHPEANAIHVPYDSAVLLGVSAALLESGRNDQIELIGGEGFPSNVELIRANKGQDAAMAFPAKWTGYAAIDTMNSVFHGQAPQDSGIGWKLIDRDHNMPPKGQGYESAVDYKGAYKKAWGVKN
ncbi:MAG TPA: substrate-binding domain-containing protein [Polyangiales bacterium]|nr:substrate-binding domain-containing protein [Polyangiales bacterium]